VVKMWHCIAYSLYAITEVLCVLQICDFGLAKWIEQAATQTDTRVRCGTIAYMAPEVFKDPSTPRTTKYDVYSFGILLWELLTEQESYEYGRDIVHLLKQDSLCIKMRHTFLRRSVMYGGLGSPTGIAHRANNRKVVGSRPTKVVCITVDR